MPEQFFYNMSEITILFLLLAIFVGSVEVGYRIGARVRSRLDEPEKSPVGALQAAGMGLIALLLAFTFSMAAQRYDARRQLVVEEANAIGTTWLRAQMLPAPFSVESADLLRRYVDVRLAFYHAGIDPLKLRQVNDESAEFHRELWAQAVAATENGTRPIPTSLFTQSLNQVIDLHAERVAAMVNRIPLSIGLLLLFIAAMTMVLTGYSCGLNGRRHFIPNAIAALLITATIVLIVDLHRPRRGMIMVSQQAMIDLRDSMSAPPPR